MKRHLSEDPLYTIVTKKYTQLKKTRLQKKLLTDLGVHVKTGKPRTPQHQGAVERCQRTLKSIFWRNWRASGHEDLLRWPKTILTKSLQEYNSMTSNRLGGMTRFQARFGYRKSILAREVEIPFHAKNCC